MKIMLADNEKPLGEAVERLLKNYVERCELQEAVWKELESLAMWELQISVADRFGISPQYLNDLLTGRRDISLPLAVRIGAALGVCSSTRYPGIFCGLGKNSPLGK